MDRSVPVVAERATIPKLPMGRRRTRTRTRRTREEKEEEEATPQNWIRAIIVTIFRNSISDISILHKLEKLHTGKIVMNFNVTLCFGAVMLRRL
jgi:hypothetical protein